MSRNFHNTSQSPKFVSAGTFHTDMIDPRYIDTAFLGKELYICNYCKTKYFISKDGEYKCPHCGAPNGSGKY